MKKIKLLFIFILLISFYQNINSEIQLQINSGTKIDKLNIVTSDSLATNQIENIWYSNTEIFIKVKVIDKNKNINLTIYNMLGKEVLKVYEGPHTRGDDPYIVRYNLPNGIYICVLLGENFKVAYKFILTR